MHGQPKGMVSISIVIPVYNEAKSIKKVIEDLHEYIIRTNMIAEIIAVNDGSRDSSLEILRQIPYITVINHRINRGYSASLKSGISKAQYDWILTYDADGQHLPYTISLLTQHTDEYDLIVGSRNSGLGHDTFVRKTGRRLVTALAQYVSEARIPDINSGFRLFRKELATKFWHLFPERFSFSTTITVASHVHRYPVCYVPIEVHARKGGASSIKPAKDFVGFLSLVTRLAIYFRPLRVFVPLSLFFFGLAILSLFEEYMRTGGLVRTTFAIFIMTGTQLLMFGLIAEMIVKRFYND